MNRSKGSAMLFLVVLVFAVGAMSLPAESAAWPERRIELICHSQAGASGDIFLRALAKFIEKKTGVPVIVNNVTGGSGANAWSRTLRARADGYTILGVSSTLIGSPLQNNIPINYTSFDPIARMFIDAVTNYVSAESPYKTLSDFVEDAKKRPGDLSVTGGTAGNIEFVTAKALMKVVSADIAIVPFEGGGEGAISVLGGHVTAGIGEFAEMASAVEGGKLRVLATFNKIPGLDIPTVADSGYPQVTVEKFRGIVVPKGVPQDIRDTLLALLKEAMDDPDFREYYTANHLVPAFSAYEDFYKVMELQHEQVKESLGK